MTMPEKTTTFESALALTIQFQEVESSIYQRWLDSGFFNLIIYPENAKRVIQSCLLHQTLPDHYTWATRLKILFLIS